MATKKKTASEIVSETMNVMTSIPKPKMTLAEAEARNKKIMDEEKRKYAESTKSSGSSSSRKSSNANATNIVSDTMNRMTSIPIDVNNRAPLPVQQPITQNVQPTNTQPAIDTANAGNFAANNKSVWENYKTMIGLGGDKNIPTTNKNLPTTDQYGNQYGYAAPITSQDIFNTYSAISGIAALYKLGLSLLTKEGVKTVASQTPKIGKIVTTKAPGEVAQNTKTISKIIENIGNYVKTHPGRTAVVGLGLVGNSLAGHESSQSKLTNFEDTIQDSPKLTEEQKNTFYQEIDDMRTGWNEVKSYIPKGIGKTFISTNDMEKSFNDMEHIVDMKVKNDKDFLDNMSVKIFRGETLTPEEETKAIKLDPTGAVAKLVKAKQEANTQKVNDKYITDLSLKYKSTSDEDLVNSDEVIAAVNAFPDSLLADWYNTARANIANQKKIELNNINDERMRNEQRYYNEQQETEQRRYNEQREAEQRRYQEQQQAEERMYQNAASVATATESVPSSTLGFGLLNSGGDVIKTAKAENAKLGLTGSEDLSQHYFGMAYGQLPPEYRQLIDLMLQ